MRLRLATEAERDLAALHLFGTIHYGSASADTYLRELVDDLQRILEWPLANPERNEVRPPVRLRSFRAHNIFYEVDQSQVSILRVLHHSADWMSTL